MTKKDLPPSRTADQFVVRLPDGMRERLAQAAKANNRSMNAEIVARLEQAFDAFDRPDVELALATAQFDTANLAFQVDSLREELNSLAELGRELLLELEKANVVARVHDDASKAINGVLAKTTDSDALVTSSDRLKVATANLKEARYRFLEARGAINVRQAKV